MEKYLLYLHSDIEASIEAAPEFQSYGLPTDPDEEEDYGMTNYVRLSDLLGIPGEAFPPADLLSEEQISDLVAVIEELWSSWNLVWEIPLDLPERNHYTALIREIKDAHIAYHPERGGEVVICDFQAGKSCPFQPDGSYCYCRKLDDSSRHDIALWEEYVRSQGLDPYREITPEEEAAFEEEMRVRDLKKRFGDDWKKYDQADWLTESDDFEEEEDFSIADLIGEAFQEEWNEMSAGLDEDPTHSIPGFDLNSNNLDCSEDEDEDDLDLPL